MPDTIFSEINECTKILRHALISFLSSRDETKYSGLVIECIWKIMLINMETLLEHESQVINETAIESRKNFCSAEERLQKQVARLNTREKEIELDFTIQREKLEVQVNALMQDKERLLTILETRALENQELMNPSRFMQVHYFLNEFAYKFDSIYEKRLEKFNITNNILKTLTEDENSSKELNDELSTKEMYFPKYIITILRELQKQLDITPGEINYRINANNETMTNIMTGIIQEKNYESTYSQIDPPKNSDSELMARVLLLIA